jgi:SAM-dependent methyltransferase
MNREWKEAQRDELAVWKNWGDEPVPALRRRAQMLDAYCLLDAANADASTRTLLEVGAAGAPVISFLPAAHRIFVDPLFGEIHDLFREQFESESGTSEFHSEPAEDLSFIAPDSVDTAFCLNVLDHTERPERILSQLARTLAPDGVLLLSVDCYSGLWLRLRSLRMLLRGKNQNDILHPHHFTVASLIDVANRAGLVGIRCFLAPGDGLSKASNYTTTSEFPLDGRFKAFVKQAMRLYVLLRRKPAE